MGAWKEEIRMFENLEENQRSYNGSEGYRTDKVSDEQALADLRNLMREIRPLKYAQKTVGNTLRMDTYFVGFEQDGDLINGLELIVRTEKLLGADKEKMVSLYSVPRNYTKAKFENRLYKDAE